VHVYLLRPPASAAEVLRSEVIVQGKWNKAKHAIGSSSNAPFEDKLDIPAGSARPESAPAKAQRLHAILERWRRPQSNSDCFDTQVATVHASVDGFIAAIAVDARPLLLASSGCVSVNLDAQIEACLLCEGDELRTNPDDYRDAVERIHSWLAQDLASSSAGVASSHSRVRRHFLQRIESAIQNAPPHLRAARSQVAARARSIVTSQHGAALEAELELLARSKLPDHDLLMAVVGLQSGRQSGQRAAKPAPTLAIHAVLLLRPRSRRSHPPRARGSP
jgi:hypothetical protein